jgi:hypothetical protein
MRRILQTILNKLNLQLAPLHEIIQQYSPVFKVQEMVELAQLPIDTIPITPANICQVSN